MVNNKQPIQEQEVLSLKPHGLCTYPNPFSATPQGAMLTAVNVNLDRPFVLEQRRGFAQYGSSFSDYQTKLFSFQGSLIAVANDIPYYDSDGAGTWSAIDITSAGFNRPDGALTVHSIEANKNIYFTTDNGLQKADDVSGPIVSAGMPAGLDGSGTTTGSGWFADQTQVAYRIVFGYTDANNNLILGAPSQRIVVSNNTGSAKNVALNFTLPSDETFVAASSWIYQVYRSPQSANLTTEPNDECQLVYTGTPSASDISNGYVNVTDNVPDSLKGETIYTASSQQGITQANTVAPLATDATYFKGYSILANTRSSQQFFLTLVSVGSPNLQLDDTVDVDGVTFTAKSSENIAAKQFKLSTGGTPSQNITDTANSLVRVINRNVDDTSVYAYYRSGYSDLPGRILLEKQAVGGSSFDVESSRSGAFVPDIGTTMGTSSSDPSLYGKNRLSISKFQQPEAYPPFNTIPVGSADAAILRVIALRDYTLIFKEDGVFQLAGEDISAFQVQEVDRTIILRGLETAVPLNNKVYMFSNQTVVSVTVNEGAILKSQDIQADLLRLSSPLNPDFDSVSFAVPYESDNKYILGTISSVENELVSQCFIYNYITNAWTTWELPLTVACGLVNPADNKLYFGSSDVDSLYVYKERKNYDSTDFADEDIAVTITDSDGLSVEVTDSSNLLAGYTLNQGLLSALITEVIDTTHILVDRAQSWEADDATVFVPISITVRFTPEACGNSGVLKHFKEAHSIFLKANFESLALGFYTDFNNAIDRITLVPKASDGWGVGPWGLFPWGSGSPEAQVIRGFIPISQRRGHWINFTIDYASALTNFSFGGLALFYQTNAQRFH